MSRKEDIIDSISQYTAHQIVQFLAAGEITVQEILEENPAEFDHIKRFEVEQLIRDNAEQTHDKSWIQLYLDNYPQGKYYSEVKGFLSGPVPPPVPENEFTYDFEEETEFEPEAPEPPADPWEAVDKTSIEDLSNFVEYYPDHPMVRDARKLINQLNRESSLPRGPEWLKKQLATSAKNPMVIAQLIIDAYENKRISTSELLDMIKEDHNLLPFLAVQTLVEEGIISTFDLEKAGIDKDFCNVINGTCLDLIDNPVITDFMENPDRINQVCQEIYFWGMPSSGKTCALGAILSAAGTGKIAKTIEKNTACRGVDYMRQLSQIFQPDKISIVPAGTNASFVSDMSFWLLDDKDKMHSITMIDLAGEMLHAMYLVDQGRFDDLSPDQQTGYNCMKNLLVDNRSRNSKIHFFVVEYGGHERREKDIRQVDMLDGALSHIKNLGILDNTDAIYILLTKADKAFSQPGDVNKILGDYVKNHYQAFYNNLILNTKKINGGKVEMIPFSIGDVCFQDLCRFDDETANDMVRLFLERTVGEKTGRIGRITNTFRK